MGTMNRIGKTATSIERKQGGLVSVRYHSTEVVRVAADGTVTLNTGGWRTATTKARMNQAANEFGLGYMVYQEKGDWFVSLRQSDGSWHQVPALPFEDYTISFKPISVV